MKLTQRQLSTLLDALPDPAFILTRSGKYVAIYGGTDKRYYHDGSHLLGLHLHDVLVKEKADWFLFEINKALDNIGLHIVEYGLSGKDVKGLDDDGPSDVIQFEGRITKLDFMVDGEDAVLWVASNITERHFLGEKLKQNISELEKSQSKLELCVAERTSELNQKTERLQETNTALKVLLEKRDEDSDELKENIALNIEKLIQPYLKRLIDRSDNETNKTLLGILKINLSEITSAFLKTKKHNISNLTPTQIQIANLIKQGKKTKEIAALLHLSPLTISRHRQDIRRRLGLDSRKTNLRTYLSSM